jgi:hypothetical protein
MLPYPTRAGLVAAGVERQDVVATARDLLDAIFMQLAGELAIARVAGAIPMFMGHVNVAGSLTATGQPQIGMEIEVDRAMLQRLPVVYTALSHIHLAQELGTGVYAGSIAPMSWGETDPKSFPVIECERATSGEWQATWTRHPIATAPLYHVEGELTRDRFDYHVVGDSLKLLSPADGQAVAPVDWTGCEVRVRYQFAKSTKGVLDESKVRDAFPGALRLEIEPVAVPDRDLRAPEVAAAVTLHDKLAAMKKSPLTTAEAEKLTALEQQDPTVLLSAVANRLAALEQLDAQAVTV